MNSKADNAMNGIRTLSNGELDAVSGGAYKEAFNFSVAGMNIAGGYDDKTGGYNVVVEYGSSYVWQGKY